MNILKKLLLAIIFGVRIFRVFEVLGKLPYYVSVFAKIPLKVGSCSNDDISVQIFHLSFYV